MKVLWGLLGLLVGLLLGLLPAAALGGIVLGIEALPFASSDRTAIILAFVALLFIVAIRYGYFALSSVRVPEGMTGAAKWRVTITTLVLSVGLPVIFMVLATAGVSRSTIIAMFSSGPSGVHLHPWGIPEAFSLILIPLLVVALPEFLGSKGRDWRANSSVPGWLAGFAAFLTAVYILLQHFGGGVLAKSHVGALSVAAFGAAVLLAPFYRIVANACWKDGITTVFDPGQWWSAWSVAYQEMKGSTGGHLDSSERVQRQNAEI